MQVTCANGMKIKTANGMMWVNESGDVDYSIYVVCNSDLAM